MPYALLSYNTTNLGDEIQSIAAQQFLPSTNILVDRDQPNLLPAEATGSYKIILNGWHTHHPENWPPSPALIPLLVSMHLTSEVRIPEMGNRTPAEILLSDVNLEYLRRHAPIGARDHWTIRLLHAKNVEAYFSACMTLTLGSGSDLERGDYVCAVDLPDPVLKRLEAKVRGRMVVTTHADEVQRPFADRCRRARRLLSIYARAKCVVTARLHCALPCLALRTPVLFIMSAKDTYRFTGLKELLHSTTPEVFLSGTDNTFDPNNPPANDETYRQYRNDLIRTVSRFIDPERVQSDAPPHPFIPDPDLDGIIDTEHSLALAAAEASRARAVFQWILKPDIDYTSFGRPDFLRELARAHRAFGNLPEARRLLQAAHQERPSGPYIKQLLDDVIAEILRVSAPAEATGQPPVAPPAGGERDPIQAVIDACLTYLPRERLQAIDQCCRSIEAMGIPGLFIEAGTALGGSAIVIAKAKAPARQFKVYDVFSSRVPSFRRDWASRGQAEQPHVTRVLPFDDEFREEIGFDGIQEKFGQGVA